MPAERGPSGTGHDSARAVKPECLAGEWTPRRVLNLCRAEEIEALCRVLNSLPVAVPVPASEPADPVVSPADTPGDDLELRALEASVDDIVALVRERDALLAVGERDKAEIEALTAAVEGLLDVGTRSRSGDPSLDPEEWFAIRDYAQKVLKDGGGAELRESRERDRQQIARLTETLREARPYVLWMASDAEIGDRTTAETVLAQVDAVLADEEDAGDG